jgi:hypothetical protein
MDIPCCSLLCGHAIQIRLGGFIKDLLHLSRGDLFAAIKSIETVDFLLNIGSAMEKIRNTAWSVEFWIDHLQLRVDKPRDKPLPNGGLDQRVYPLQQICGIARSCVAPVALSLFSARGGRNVDASKLGAYHGGTRGMFGTCVAYYRKDKHLAPSQLCSQDRLERCTGLGKRRCIVVVVEC